MHSISAHSVMVMMTSDGKKMDCCDVIVLPDGFFVLGVVLLCYVVHFVDRAHRPMWIFN
jgi:hypothetical protein